MTGYCEHGFLDDCPECLKARITELETGISTIVALAGGPLSPDASEEKHASDLSLVKQLIRQINQRDQAITELRAELLSIRVKAETVLAQTKPEESDE